MRMTMTAQKDYNQTGEQAPIPQKKCDNWYHEEYFVDALVRERKRTGRTCKSLWLMLVDIDAIQDSHIKKQITRKMSEVLALLTRDTDIKGWYRQNAVLGVIFTETNGVDPGLLRKKIEAGICRAVPPWHRELIALRFHVFPEHGEKAQAVASADLTLYPDMEREKRSRRVSFALKRTLDIVGSVAGLILFSPLFVVIPLAIKCSSKGPVLFRQERVGQFGKRFQFLKFRSMQVNNDASVHRDYLAKFIKGKAGAEEGGNSGTKVYKLTNDSRVTPIGKILRKTSMDELPQFLNVLRGEMSLVGPRPPIPYEVMEYDIWHWRRIIEIKPGITGLWQVKGRSTTTFDEMVRLDLQYAREWSVWQDIKLLLQTPGAVLRGKGAC